MCVCVCGYVWVCVGVCGCADDLPLTRYVRMQHAILLMHYLHDNLMNEIHNAVTSAIQW